MQSSSLVAIRASAGGSPPPPSRFARSGERLSATALESSVLVIEDEMMIAWQLQDLLCTLGFAEVRVAASFDQAAAAVRDGAPDLLVCDVNLGGGPDGIETAQAIRGDGPMPVVFITGYAGDELSQRIDSAVPGALLLRKPVVEGALVGALRRMLEGPALN